MKFGERFLKILGQIEIKRSILYVFNNFIVSLRLRNDSVLLLLETKRQTERLIREQLWNGFKKFESCFDFICSMYLILQDKIDEIKL